MDSLQMTTGTTEWLQEHLNIVRDKIVDEALELAKSEGRQKIEPKDIAEASKRFAPGVEFPEPIVVKERRFTEKIFSSISAITIVSAILAIIFGILGVWKTSQSAFDIAKIFAGAVVGSTGVVVNSAIKRS